MTAVRALGLVVQIRDEIGRRIAAGEFAAGTAVNIADVARKLAVSATPVREALARLAAEGQLHFVDNIGYSVPPLPDAHDYANWASARVIVEANALLSIAGPIDSHSLDAAAAINARIRSTHFGTTHSGIVGFSELNWRFHATLIALAQNPWLDQLHQRLYAAPQFSRIFLGRGNPNQALIADEHDAIIRRLRRGDRSGASAKLRDHILDSLERDARLSDVPISLRPRNHRDGDHAAPSRFASIPSRTTTLSRRNK